MANINLKGIRAAGAKVGRGRAITGFLAQRARASERELDHQRILEREEKSRAHQTAEAEKTRALTKEGIDNQVKQFHHNLKMTQEQHNLTREQMRLAAERHGDLLEHQGDIRGIAEKTRLSTEAHQKRIHDTATTAAATQKMLGERRVKVQEDQLAAEKEIKRINRLENSFKFELSNRLASKTSISSEERESILEVYKDVPNLDHMLNIHNATVKTIRDDEFKKTAKDAKALIIEGRGRLNTYTQDYIDKAVALKIPFFENNKTVAALNSAIQHYNNIAATKQLNSKETIATVGVGLDDRPIQIKVPTGARETEIFNESKNKGRQLTEALDYLTNFDKQMKAVYGNNTPLIQKNKDAFIDAYISRVRKIAPGFRQMAQGKQLGGERRPSRELLLQSMPYFRSLADNDSYAIDENKVVEHAGLFQQENNRTGQTNVLPRFDRITGREAAMHGAEPSPLTMSVPLIKGLRKKGQGISSNSQVATFLTDLNKFKDDPNNPEMSALIRRRSELFQRWHMNGYKGQEGGSRYETLLMGTLKDADGNLDPDSAFILASAIVAANPEFTYAKAEHQKGALDKNDNRNIQKPSEEFVNKTILNAEDAIRESDEVIRLANEILMASENTWDSLGVAGDVAVFFDTAKEVLETAPSSIVRGLKGVMSLFGIRDKEGSFLGLDSIKAKSRKKYVKGNGEEHAEIKDGMISRVEAKADEQLREISSWGVNAALLKGGYTQAQVDVMSAEDKKKISNRVRANRQRIVLKKIALTYRMSGLLQGDSSGRTISNADFDIALRALWGEKYAVEAKMKDIIQFFKHRRSISRIHRDYVNTGLMTPVMKVNEAHSKALSEEYEKRLLDPANGKVAGSFLESAASAGRPDTLSRNFPDSFKADANEVAKDLARRMDQLSPALATLVRRPSDMERNLLVPFKGKNKTQKRNVNLKEYRQSIAEVSRDIIKRMAKQHPKEFGHYFLKPDLAEISKTGRQAGRELMLRIERDTIQRLRTGNFE